MSDLGQERRRETEEEEEEEGSSPEVSSAESEEESCWEHCQERGSGCQDPPVHRPFRRHPPALQSCRRRLLAADDLQGGLCSLHCTGHRRDGGAVAHPWGRGSPPWDPHLGSWVQDTGAVCQDSGGLEQMPCEAGGAERVLRELGLAQGPPAVACMRRRSGESTPAATAASSRTLSHPSFQTFFAAVSASRSSCPPSPGGQVVPRPSGGPLPLVDCSSFFYTDPMMPPGFRIYSGLSASSQEVLHCLQLNTPLPIMCPGPAASPGHRWLSDLECRAVSALLALPASPCTCPPPGAAERGATGPLAPCLPAQAATGAALQAAQQGCASQFGGGSWDVCGPQSLSGLGSCSVAVGRDSPPLLLREEEKPEGERSCPLARKMLRLEQREKGVGRGWRCTLC